MQLVPLHIEYPFFGIDYGSKMAGTTVVAYVNESGKLILLQSAKKSDADQYISKVISQLGPKQIFIDAPLSLPGSYYGKSSDFFYRASDRLLKAMSPMFLGGLTARAIKLKSQYDLEWYEVYPSALVQEWHITSHYKKKDSSTLSSFLELWQKEVPIHPQSPPANYHQMDALLAWSTGWRHQHGHALPYGDRGEGVIWV